MKLETIIMKESMKKSEEGVFIIPSNKYTIEYINECISKGYITQIIQNDIDFKNTNITTFNVFFNKKYGKNNVVLKYKEFECESETFNFSPIHSKIIEKENKLKKEKEGEKILKNYTDEEIDFLEKNCTGMVERTRKGEMNLLDIRNNIHMLLKKISNDNSFITY